jgi:hypothetical protein
LPPPPAKPRPGERPDQISAEIQSLIDQAAGDLAEYQKLTAEGRLGEAGMKLESLKRALEALAARRGKR